MILQLVLLGIVSSVCSQSLHHAMSPEDLHKVFSVKNPSEVPEYDVVPVSISKSRKRRDGLYMTTQWLGEHIYEWLNPTDGVLASEDTPVFLLSRNINNPNYLAVRKDTTMIKELYPSIYENGKKGITVAINNHGRGKRSVTGYVGDMYIQPVPSHLMEHAKRHRRSVKGSLDGESEDQIYHIVHKIPKIEGVHFSPSIEELKRSNRTARSVQKGKWIYPEILYPEVLVIIDYPLAEKFQHRLDYIILYVLSYWNGVDMRYRDLDHPKIRFNIYGIVIAREAYLLSYQIPLGTLGLDLNASMDEKVQWLFNMGQHFGYGENAYDFAVTMNTYEICDKPTHCSILGVANLNGACTARNIAFVKDFGSFGSIMTTAHELGHGFGISHDETSKYHCNEQTGNVMAPFKLNTVNSYTWSYCSLVDFQNFIMRRGAECLRNPPNARSKLPKFMPGMLMNAHQQCAKLLGSDAKASVIDKSICIQLQCTKWSRFSLPEAADGTECGPNRICLHGHCGLIEDIKY